MGTKQLAQEVLENQKRKRGKARTADTIFLIPGALSCAKQLVPCWFDATFQQEAKMSAAILGLAAS